MLNRKTLFETCRNCTAYYCVNRRLRVYIHCIRSASMAILEPSARASLATAAEQEKNMFTVEIDVSWLADQNVTFKPKGHVSGSVFGSFKKTINWTYHVFLGCFKDAIGGFIRSELTSGVGWTKMSRVCVRCWEVSKRELVVSCRMPRILRDGGWGWCRTRALSLVSRRLRAWYYL